MGIWSGVADDGDGLRFGNEFFRPQRRSDFIVPRERMGYASACTT